MGYRSDVEIVVYGEPETFDTFINAMKLIDHRVFTDWNEWIDTNDDNAITYHEVPHHDGQVTKLMCFSISGVKWYDSYPQIIAWEKDFLPKAVDSGLNWEKVRVGEESDDIEHEEGGEDVQNYLYTDTNIERNF